MDLKWQLLHVMTSQFYEWLPWLEGILGEVPPDEEEGARLHWLKSHYSPLQQLPAAQCKDAFQEWCGDTAEGMPFAEMFQVCEYGTQPDRDRLFDLFSF